jgi:hypothetical protein
VNRRLGSYSKRWWRCDMRGRLLHLSSLPVLLVIGGKTVKEVTTVVKTTVLYTQSTSIVRFVALCCAVLLAMRKITRLSTVTLARSRRFATPGGGPR